MFIYYAKLYLYKKDDNMNPKILSRKKAKTPFIQLTTRKCQACWSCINCCPNKVIGKIDFLGHRHTIIYEPDKCTGCLKCLSTCEYGAYSKLDKAKRNAEKRWSNAFRAFLINNLLLLSGLGMILSGLTLQFGFHMGEHRNRNIGFHQPLQYEQIREIDMVKKVWGLNYSEWATTHKVAIVLVSILVMYHIYTHWKWYKGVISKNLLMKNKLVITLSALFLLVAITGLVPWFLDLSGSTNILRIHFIEIHDKLALILFVYLVLHVTKRFKWFAITFDKLKQ